MTDMKKDDMKMNKTDEKRIKRRSLLKAGAVIAPLAITLHGGVAFAQVNSAGRCIENMKTNVQIPLYEEVPLGSGTYQQTGTTVNFSPENTDFTGRFNVNGVPGPETHWQYIENEQLSGITCLQSYANAGTN